MQITFIELDFLLRLSIFGQLKDHNLGREHGN